MKNFKLILLFFFLPILGFSQAYTQDDIHTYIATYKDLAIRKMYEYKIPASITLAQGILESACGTSRLATYGNNHFGIKCHTWTGDTIRVDDDELQECFRKYDKVEDSYNDHSLFLTSRSRYDGLFELDLMDHKAWAKGLKAAGYATNPRYPDILISLIERFDLAQYDQQYQELAKTDYFEKNRDQEIAKKVEVEKVEEKVEVAPVSEKREEVKTDEVRLVNGRMLFMAHNPAQFKEENYPFTSRYVYINNKTLFVIAGANDSYKKIANDVQLSERNLLNYNDVINYKELTEGQVVYIEKKQKTNKAKTHKVTSEHETLEYIAQKYGIRLESLCKWNNLHVGAKLREGERVKLSY